MRKKIGLIILCICLTFSMNAAPALAEEVSVPPVQESEVTEDVSAAEETEEVSDETDVQEEVVEQETEAVEEMAQEEASAEEEVIPEEVAEEPVSEKAEPELDSGAVLAEEIAGEEEAAGENGDSAANPSVTEEETATAGEEPVVEEKTPVEEESSVSEDETTDETTGKEEETKKEKEESSNNKKTKKEALVVKVSKYGSYHKRLLVEWNSYPGAKGYRVYRSTNKKKGFRLVNTTQTACRFLDKGLSPNTTYYYKVRAYKGNALKKPYKIKALRTSKVVSCKTPSSYVGHYYTDTSVARTAANTVTVTSATSANAKRIYKKLEKGRNFYIYVKSSKPARILNKLKAKVRKNNKWAIGFTTLSSYYGANGKYFLIDAQTYKIVKKYIKQAYTERMEEYKIYLDCGKKKSYFTTYKNAKNKSRRFVASYRDNLFECEYGTPFKDLSSESKFLFITPGTCMTVRSNYMTFKFDYNVGENAYDILVKMYHKNAEGVCRHYALALQTICDHLGIECWMPVEYAFNHQWGFAKTKSASGKTVYYTMDNEFVHVTKNEKALKHERLGDYSRAVRAAMGSKYPWR